MVAELKQSGIRWIGDIPEHWDVMPLYGVFNERFIKNKDGQENNVLSLSYGRIVRRNIEDNFGLMPESFNIYQIVDKGNIILRLTDLQNDKRSLRVGFVKEKGIISSAYVCLELKDEGNPEYFYYLIHNYDIQKIFYNLGAGVRQSMGFSDLKRMPLIIPPKEEQDEIVSHIKIQFEKINHFIQKKQRFIELLIEQRQSIIDHSLTTDSKDFVSKRLKFVADLRFSNVDKHTIEDEIPVRLCNYVDVYKHDYITNDMDLMRASATKSEIEKFKVFKGDVIITKDSEEASDIAVPTFVKEDLENVVCGYHLALIRADETQVLSEFLFRAFQSKKLNSYFEVRATGVTRVGLSLDDISSVRIDFPKSLTEQQEIINHIKTETKTIDTAIAKAEKEIELIKEYKEAMIAEAVMGKMKI